MSWLFAKLYDRMMAQTEAACLGAWRAEIVAPLSGRVLEIGAGTGANLALYPPSVTELVATEPDPHMRKRLESKDASGRKVKVVDASADHLPFADASFDAAVSTLVLCTVPHPDAAIQEVHRVLRPGGVLAFVEHVAAEEGSSRYKWQRRIDPIWTHLAAGCHVTRRTLESIERAGFAIEHVQRESLRKAPPFVRPSVRGHARKLER